MAARTLVGIGLAIIASGAIYAQTTQRAASTNAPAATTQATTAPANTAVVPVGKLEKDFYDWDARHKAVLAQQAKQTPEIVLIGDSITHMWGGLPQGPGYGAKIWQGLFGERVVLNMGFGYDRTQNVLWRLDHGEMDGCTPKYVVLNIGTNNFTGTANARQNTPAEVRDGIVAIIERVHKKSPQSKVVLMAVFPRGHDATDSYRGKIAKLNELLAAYSADHRDLAYIDLKDKFLAADGTLPKEMMRDGVHPSEQGYQIWADALKEVLK